MTELEHRMVNKLQVLLANQIRLAQQLNAISALERSRRNAKRVRKRLEEHGQYFESLLTHT